jgi:hypothetical protein
MSTSKPSKENSEKKSSKKSAASFKGKGALGNQGCSMSEEQVQAIVFKVIKDRTQLTNVSKTTSLDDLDSEVKREFFIPIRNLVRQRSGGTCTLGSLSDDDFENFGTAGNIVDAVFGDLVSAN